MSRLGMSNVLCGVTLSNSKPRGPAVTCILYRRESPKSPRIDSSQVSTDRLGYLQSEKMNLHGSTPLGSTLHRLTPPSLYGSTPLNLHGSTPASPRGLWGLPGVDP